MPKLLLIAVLFICAQFSFAQNHNAFTHEDTLRGSITPERKWWDVQRYSIDITPDFSQKTITGKNTITYKVLDSSYSVMQIDLQAPLVIDSVLWNRKSLAVFNAPRGSICLERSDFLREKKILSFSKKATNVWLIHTPKNPTMHEQDLHEVTIYYHGSPHEAINPPWDGGWIWKKDSLNRIWSTVSCEGIGASVWYPCKDHWSDEPDKGAMLEITVPDTLEVVGNGNYRYYARDELSRTKTYVHIVQNPINSYNIIPYIGKYSFLSDTLQGEKGMLSITYCVLDYNKEKARRHFAQVKPMLRAFEYWFGPYPFYEDGYKLVESPYLGMEHQSAIAYGNKYKNGYNGRDLSGTGWGLDWDFIIVHESGHEWFGNNITAKDVADMWIHESFTNYSETLYTEYYYGAEAANDYCYGIRKLIKNDRPIIGCYDVHDEGSGDMYYKGANMLHSIRHVIDDDVKFRNILRGLNSTFYHHTVTGTQVQQYIDSCASLNLDKVFQQYLTTTQIPRLEYKLSQKGTKLRYRWSNCVEGFDMPLTIRKGKEYLCIKPTEKWQTIAILPQQIVLMNPVLIERLYYIMCEEK